MDAQVEPAPAPDDVFPPGHAFAGLRRRHYRCLMIDPPWKFAAGTKSRPQHYPRMTDQEIAALPVRELCHPDGAWVAVWVTSPKSHHVQEICGRGRFSMNGKTPVLKFDGWRLKYSGRGFVWVKTHRRNNGAQRALFINTQSLHMNTGYTTRKNAEDVLLFKVGRPKRLANDVHEIILAPLREHSSKPEEAYELLERFCPGPRAEVFSRRSRPGWDTSGNETGKFDRP